jgi:hypothetical protein
MVFYFLKDLALKSHAPGTRKLSETQVFFAPNYVFYPREREDEGNVEKRERRPE